jgi:signal transduction histidine kinase/FixJ family two-component response regulator
MEDTDAALLERAGLESGQPRVRGSQVAVPLIAEQELLGAVVLAFAAADAVSDSVLVAAREVADQLAIALRHASLHAELRAVLDGTMDAIVVLDSERRFVAANTAASQLYDVSPEQIVGRRLDDFVGGRRAEADWHAFLRAGTVDTVWEGDHGNGRRSLEVRGRAEFLPGRHLFVLRDVTERRKLEEQLRQAQKMEAIGQLAGGVAHDFNNLLTVIAGYSQLAQRSIGAGPGAKELAEVERAADRATALTRQLLAFSRRQLLNPTLLDLNEVLTALMPMLDRLIGDDTSVAMLAADDLPQVRADRGQIEQVIVNLAVNARDAMPNGGTLTIETRPALLDAAYAAEHAGVQAGPYVCVTVADTGAGMDAETLPHIFEPFYTTKEAGHGTGLGLSTVHGIVTQSQGHVAVYSEPGFGSAFKIYLPAVGSGSPSAESADPPQTAQLAGSETVLLCEDQDHVRQLIETVLTRRGYRVLAAGRPSQALAIASREEAIDVAISDVIMPEMPGPELARRLHELRPGLPILFVSGYTAEIVRGRGNLPAGSAFLEKPFDEASLLRAIRALLDGPPRPHTDASPKGSSESAGLELSARPRHGRRLDGAGETDADRPA